MPENLYWLEIILLLAGILISCEVFTNAIENLGEKLNIGHEFTGSVLAAVGTALPETILPLIAIYMASTGMASEVSAKEDIAIGAILGAPFMLSTLAMFLLGLSIYTHRKQRGSEKLEVNLGHLERDLRYFLKVFVLAVATTIFSTYYLNQIVEIFCSSDLGFKLMRLINFGAFAYQCSDSTAITVRVAIGMIIILLYVKYLIDTYKSASQDFSGEFSIDDCPILYLERYFKFKVTMPTVLIQVLIGLAGIIYFAHGFIHGVEHVASMFNISPLVVSLIVCPIATELPEKVNSWIWSSQGKDVLAMGNISGAMVFQASIPCAIGIILTPWQLTPVALLCALISIIASAILLIFIKTKKQIDYKALLLCGSLYLIYIVSVFLIPSS